MDRMGYRSALRIVKLINAAGMTAIFGACWYWFYADNIRSPYYNRGNWVVIAIFAVLYLTYGRVYDAFKVSLYRISEMVYSQSLAAILSNAVMYVVIWLLNKDIPPVWPLLLATLVQILYAVAWSYHAHRWYFATFPPRRTAILYDARPGMEQLIHEYGLEKKFSVVKTASVYDCLDGNLEMLQDM